MMKLNLQIHVSVLGKVETPFTDKNGQEQKSCSLNVEQDNGATIAQIKTSKDVFPLVERGKEYTFDVVYSESQYGTSLRIVGIHNQGKAVQ